MEDSERTSIKRRNVLQKVGTASVVASSFSGVGSAVASRSQGMSADRHQELLHIGNKIRENAGKNAMEQFLRAHGFEIASMNYQMELSNPDKGVSSQEFDNVDGNGSDCDICLDFTLFETSVMHTIQMSWNYDTESGFWDTEYGEDPKDVAGCYFDSQKWDFYSRSLDVTSYGSEYVTVSDDDISEGLGFEVNDFLGDNDESETHHCGVHVVAVGNYSPSERDVRGQYVHTWNTSQTDLSIGVSYPAGLSVSTSASDSLKKEATSTEGDGDTLMILNQAEAQ